jgi:hypothetical protein
MSRARKIKNNLNWKEKIVTLRELILDFLGGALIIAGLYFLKVAFKKLTPEDRICWKERTSGRWVGYKANHVYVGAVILIVGFYILFKSHFS